LDMCWLMLASWEDAAPENYGEIIPKGQHPFVGTVLLRSAPGAPPTGTLKYEVIGDKAETTAK